MEYVLYSQEAQWNNHLTKSHLLQAEFTYFPYLLLFKKFFSFGVRNGFIQVQREANSTYRAWAIAEGERSPVYFFGLLHFYRRSLFYEFILIISISIFYIFMVANTDILKFSLALIAL